MLREIHSAAELDEALDGSVSLDGFRLQNVDLSGSAGTRLREAAEESQTPLWSSPSPTAAAGPSS